MAELYWAMPDFCLGVDAPAEMFAYKTGKIETGSICFKLSHDGLPNLECNLREGAAYLLIAHSGPTSRHNENDGLPVINFQGLTRLEEGCMKYSLFPEGKLIWNAGYFYFFRLQTTIFSASWKVSCPYSGKSRFYSLNGNREEKTIYLRYAIHTL